MESEKPGSRRPGQPARPGNRAAGALAEQVELTVASDTPAAESPGSSPGSPQRAAEPDVETVVRNLPALLDAARTAAIEAAREETRAFLRQFERDFRAAIRIEELANLVEALQSAADDIASAAQGTDMLLNEVPARMDETIALFRTACAEVITKLEEVREVSQRLVDEAAARDEERMKRIRTVMNQATDEARDAARAASWRPWVMATSCALVLTLGVSVLRPGWTMSAGQRRAERVGDTVIRAYEAASPADRAEMRKVLGWRDEPGDTTAATGRRR